MSWMKLFCCSSDLNRITCLLVYLLYRSLSLPNIEVGMSFHNDVSRFIKFNDADCLQLEIKLSSNDKLQSQFRV